MQKAKRTPIFIRGIILISLGMSVPSMTFGEILSPLPVEEKAKKTKSFPKKTQQVLAPFLSESTGFRTAESEGETSTDPLSSRRRALSVENQELLETTDESGGRMIDLQGRFQCGLKVSRKSLEPNIEKALLSVIP